MHNTNHPLKKQQSTLLDSGNNYDNTSSGKQIKTVHRRRLSLTNKNDGIKEEVEFKKAPSKRNVLNNDTERGRRNSAGADDASNPDNNTASMVVGGGSKALVPPVMGLKHMKSMYVLTKSEKPVSKSDTPVPVLTLAEKLNGVLSEPLSHDLTN